MCGRFTLATPATEWARLFAVPELPVLEPRYNIAPTQDVAVVRLRPPDSDASEGPPDQAREIRLLSWGLVPHWSGDSGVGSRLINARSETAADKPAFRDPFRDRRCLVVADGFYEWRREGSGKQPYWIHASDGRTFAFAGLWDRWKGRGRPALETCAILTTAANERLLALHDRMPVILRASDHARWLDPAVRDRDALADLFEPFPADSLRVTPVSSRVNSVSFDDPACLESVEMQEDLFR